MTKKKPQIVIPELSPDETVIDNPTPSALRYHAVFTPTWRTELDCGDHSSVKAAQKAIQSVIEGLGVAINYCAWAEIDDAHWIATGHDGQTETTLPIATITRVTAE